MRDISYKQSTLRTAVAQGFLYCSADTVDAVAHNRLPKGSPFDFAKAAGYMGAKHTAALIPHCHPVSIDGLDIVFEACTHRPGWMVKATGTSVGRTGIEMEALTAVSLTLLTLYDLFKNIDKELEISGIKLLNKKGGKSDREKWEHTGLPCAVLWCSTAGVLNDKSDHAPRQALEMLSGHGAAVAPLLTVPEEREPIMAALTKLMNEGNRIIFTCGGTGLGKSDFVPKLLNEIIDQPAEGLVHAMRQYGLDRNPLAIMSQLTAGSVGHTLLVSLPGSADGVKECLCAILPQVFHAAKMLLKKQG